MPYPDKMDTFVEKLNKQQDDVYTIEEELLVAEGVWEGFLAHDNINNKSLYIYTGPGFTGQKVTNYFLSIPQETPWKRYLKVFADTPKVYVTYETPGDQVEAEDVNRLQDSLTNTQGEVERYKAENEQTVSNMDTRLAMAENNKAEKTYVDTELLKKADKNKTYTKTEADTRIQELIGAAPEALDTLQEIAEALNNDPDFAATMTSELSTKVDKVAGKQLSTEDYSTSEKTKLAGIEVGANKYTHPASHPASMITQDSEHRYVTDTEKVQWNTVTNKVDKVVGKGLSTNDFNDSFKTKLVGMEEGANNYTHPSTHSLEMIRETDAKKIMTIEERNKLGSIEAEANKYTHPATHPAAMIEQDSTHRFVTDSEKSSWNNKCNKDDLRLSDARTPLPHEQEISTITGLQTALDNKLDKTGGNVTGSLLVESSSFPVVDITRNAPGAGGIYGGAKLERTCDTTSTDGTGIGFYLKAPNSSSSSTFAACFGGALADVTPGQEKGEVVFGVSHLGEDPYLRRDLVIQALDDSSAKLETSGDIYAKGNKVACEKDLPTKTSQLTNDSEFVTLSELGQAGYGDMMKSVYDADDDGIVDKAKFADAVSWSSVAGKPGTYPPSAHNHDSNYLKKGPITWNDLKGV